MKAPAAIDRWLRTAGFGYSQGYYLGLAQDRLLVNSAVFSRTGAKFTLQIAVHYPERDGGLWMSPPELSAFSPATALSIVSSSSSWGSASELGDAIPKHLSSLYVRLGDANAMLGVCDFMLGFSQTCSALSPIFDVSGLVDGARHPSPARFLRKAAYLNLAGRFDESLECVRALGRSGTLDTTEAKLSRDAVERRVAVPDEMIRYLEKIGSSV